MLIFLHLGFTVRLDHSAKQIGSSCGIVAARVVTWLRESGDSFMDHDTHDMATIWDHIPPANTALANDENCKTPAFKLDRRQLWCTDTLLTGEVVFVTNLFNGKRASELIHVDAQRTDLTKVERVEDLEAAKGLRGFAVFWRLTSSLT